MTYGIVEVDLNPQAATLAVLDPDDPQDRPPLLRAFHPRDPRGRDWGRRTRNEPGVNADDVDATLTRMGWRATEHWLRVDLNRWWIRAEQGITLAAAAAQAVPPVSIWVNVYDLMAGSYIEPPATSLPPDEDVRRAYESLADRFAQYGAQFMDDAESAVRHLLGAGSAKVHSWLNPWQPANWTNTTPEAGPVAYHAWLTAYRAQPLPDVPDLLRPEMSEIRHV